MKSIIISIALIVILGASAFAQSGEGIKFESGDFKSLLAKAKAEKKPLFIDVYASWCGPCRRMASEVFTQKKVGDYFNRTFVNAKFDAELGEGVDIARRYKVTGYPTFLLIDSNGTLIGRMMGGSPADDFIKQIEKLRVKGTVK